MQKKICPQCKETKPVNEFHKQPGRKNGTSWCKTCLYEMQKQRWRDRKKKAVELFGGKCQNCGYNKNYASLDFHHLDPKEKEYGWNRLKELSWDKVIKELKKCICLCSNCHGEIHNPDFNNTLTDISNNLLNYKIESTGKCPSCEEDVYGTKYCSVECAAFSRRKVKRPDRDALKKMLATSNYSAIGRKYNVSDKTISKWAKNYGLI
jgi:hypothetical protein